MTLSLAPRRFKSQTALVSRNTVSNVERGIGSTEEHTKLVIERALGTIEDGSLPPSPGTEALRALVARVRADCEAQTLPQSGDADRKIWNLGVWAQAQRVLNILDSSS